MTRTRRVRPRTTYHRTKSADSIFIIIIKSGIDFAWKRRTLAAAPATASATPRPSSCRKPSSWSDGGMGSRRYSRVQCLCYEAPLRNVGCGEALLRIEPLSENDILLLSGCREAELRGRGVTKQSFVTRVIVVRAV